MASPPEKHGKKVIVVMPAYNAARTLQRTFAEIPNEWVDEVILVDDASKDDTVAIAHTLPIKVICHERNRGYGANQKTCYTEALKAGADIVVMLHPDYQYDPKVLPSFVEPIASGQADVVLGSRILGGQALLDGMPRYKYISNKFLTGIMNLTMRTAYTDLHCGYRAYSRHTLESVPFLRNSDGMVFDAQMVYQLHHKGLRILEIPIHARYHEEASSMRPAACTAYGIKVLWTNLRYLLHRWGILRCNLFE